MNRALRCILLLAVTSCGSSAAGGAPPEDQRSTAAPSGTSALEAAPSSSPSASASAVASSTASTSPLASSSPSSAPPAARLELPAGALFAYREGDVALSFTAPNRVTLLVPSDKPCTYELGDHGNMYSGKEVEAAWKNVDVQKATASTSVFLSPKQPMVSGEVVGPAGRVIWTAQCGGLCLDGPPGVTQLLKVLHVLATNARGVCKV